MVAVMVQDPVDANILTTPVAEPTLHTLGVDVDHVKAPVPLPPEVPNVAED